MRILISGQDGIGEQAHRMLEHFVHSLSSPSLCNLLPVHVLVYAAQDFTEISMMSCKLPLKCLLPRPRAFELTSHTSARLHVLIFYLSCLFSPNMEGLGHFRLSNNSMGNQATISDIKMESIA